MNKKLLFICIGIGLINFAHAERYLVFGGKTGWIGQKIVSLLKELGNEVICAESRLEERERIEAEIIRYKPDCIINAAGVTGRPNVDWCEDHKVETVRTNLIGTLNLFDIAHTKNIYVISFGTGCIYHYDENHLMNTEIGFTEDDEPNFKGSFYSYTKGMVDRLIQIYPNVLNLRLRMPVSDDLNPRSFVTKITRYKKVVNIPNSMSVLSDLLPLIPEIVKKRLTGNLNFVNPGVISHNEILDMYKEYVDSNFIYCNFSIEEHDSILKAKRSNNCLDTSRLLREFPHIPHIKDAIRKIMNLMGTRVKRMANTYNCK